MVVARQSIFLQDLSHYHIDESEYAGHVMLITGAANGIGRALSLYFAHYGCTVIMLDKDEQGLNSLYDEIMAKGYTEPVIFQIDLNNLTQENVDALVQQTQENFGRIDALIFCAAHYGANAPIEHYSLDDWNKSIKVGLHATFLLIKGYLPLLRATPNASVILTTSKQTRQASAYWGALAVAERGAHGLVQILADETENDDVFVFSMDPGEVKTSYMKVNYPGRVLDKLPAPESVTEAYCYLLSGKRNSGRNTGSHYYINDGKLYGYV